MLEWKTQGFHLQRSLIKSTLPYRPLLLTGLLSRFGRKSKMMNCYEIQLQSGLFFFGVDVNPEYPSTFPPIEPVKILS